MNNVNMANMNPMGGPVGMPMVNNGPMGAIQAGGPRQLPGGDNRANLNTYIYDYFLRNGMYDCARALLNSEQQINVTKESPGRRRDGDGNAGGNNLGDDSMDTDSKEDLDSKRPDDLPAPNVPNSSNSCFLYEWFCLFWDMLSAQRNKPGIHNGVSQYVSHTQQQSRLRQNQQQEMLRNMRPENLGAMQFHQNQMMQRMPNGMNMNPKQPNLARTAMANNQNNPQAIQMLQQAKQAQMQRDPSDMDGNRARPASPGSAENAPSPSKRPRLEGQGFGPQQPGMMPNGRPQQGMPGQQVGNGPNNLSAAQQMLQLNGIDPSSLTAQQFQNFQGAPPGAQAKSIATYSANLQQHQSQQMPNKQGGMPHPGPQGSPMMPQAPDGAQLGAYYNAEGMPPGAMRPGGPAGAQGAGGSNHALQDYQMQLMLLEQQNKKRLMMARQEQESMPPTMGGRQDGPGGPGGPAGPNGQPFPDTSPQGARPGASPNPSEQMKRGTPQMNPAGIPSPLPEGAGQSRGSPNPMNFIPGNMADPSAAPHFFKGGMNGMEPNMMAAGMNGMRPPSSHPGQPFNGQMTPQQQQMMARQQQQGQPGGPQMQQWQQGPNGQMVPPGAQGQQQVQGTPQQRSMPPPSAPAAGNNNANARTQPSSPSSNAAPPTPQQANKAAPKKKDTKANAKSKAAAQKKGSNANLNAGATPASEPTQEPEPATPATPITPVNAASFNKGGAQNANAAGPSAAQNGQQNAAPAPPAPVAAPQHPDPLQNGGFGLDNGGGMDFGMDFANPTLTNDVLQDFDFDSFLHDGEGENGGFDFNAGFSMDGANEIGAD